MEPLRDSAQGWVVVRGGCWEAPDWRLGGQSLGSSRGPEKGGGSQGEWRPDGQDCKSTSWGVGGTGRSWLLLPAAPRASVLMPLHLVL